MEAVSATAAPKLVRFAGVRVFARVLDVACGTGVLALTAARLGAEVCGVDFSPELLARAQKNSALMRLDVEWAEGDAEALPFEDASFDVVMSQFGHLFAPRPEVVTREMLRVLKPGGTIAFSTWPPELFVGQVFDLVADFSPPPPGVARPSLWGDPKVVRERLGDAVKDLTFERDVLLSPTLSVQHTRLYLERHVGPVRALVEELTARAPKELEALRNELERLTRPYFVDNTLRQGFLMSRATKL